MISNAEFGYGSQHFPRENKQCISTRRKSRRVIYVNTLDTTTTHVRNFLASVQDTIHSQVVASPHTDAAALSALPASRCGYDTKTLKIRSIAYSFRIIFQKVLCDNITPSSVLRRLGRLSKDMRCCWPGE